MPGRAFSVFLLAVLAFACAPGGRPPVGLRTPFRPIKISELRTSSERLVHEKVSFSATIDRVEETPGGTWLYLQDGEDRVVLYTSMSFGGTFRDSLARERMQFEVEIGEKKLTPLGTYALEILPYQISKTTYFDQAVPLDPPPAP